MATLLVRHKTVLSRFPQQDNNAAVCFAQETEEGEIVTPIKAMFLPIEFWEEMACPDEITVTVELGDTING